MTDVDASVIDVDAVDFFTDRDLLADPYDYFAALRTECPVRAEKHHGVTMLTGYDEVVQVYNDSDHFSACVSVTGPFPGFPVPIGPDDDADALIAEHRHRLPFSDQLPTMDPPDHTRHRHLLSRMITPKRLKENEAFLARLVDQQLDEALAGDGCEFMSAFANPVAMLVVADLLGVPESDHRTFRQRMLQSSETIGATDDKNALSHSPLEYLYATFSDYVRDRRANPRDDVLTGVASATFPDGTEPDVIDAVRVAANLFAAGGETTVRLLGSAVQIIAENAEIQHRLRAHPDLIPNFIEECLRYESPIRGDFRLVKQPVNLGGVDLTPGDTVMLLNAAANRDPTKFTNADTFDIDRDNARSHVAFGRGVHTCPGAPLARAEGVLTIARLLERTTEIWIDEQHHGPPDARRYSYVPTFILRGVTHLHVRFSSEQGTVVA